MSNADRAFRPRDAKWLQRGDMIQLGYGRFRTIDRVDNHYPVNSTPFTVIYFTDGTDHTYAAHATVYAWRDHK